MAILFTQNSLGQTGIQQKEALEIACKMVDYHLQCDSAYPQLVDLLELSGGVPTVSGLTDHDYPGLSDLSTSLQSLSQLSDMKKVPLPAELVEQFGHMQSNCQMGLFPEIGRAWLTIDSDIFVWRYEDGSDLAYLDGLSETILSVGLVKPKQGIFQSYIQFLLCLTTPVEIVLLGVSFSRHSDDSPLYEEMHLLPEPLFSVPTDNTYMMTVLGTDKGRIFMGGKDGAVYELAYQAESGWFSRKCHKINHSSSTLSFLVPSFLNFAFSEEDPIAQMVVDNSRYILYTRSERGTIQVFDLGTNGMQMGKVSSVSQNSIVQQAVNIAKTIDRSNFHPIVHISAIEVTESLYIHLIAVTQTGVRLYFTTTSLTHPESYPFTLNLLHVRLPPGFSANAPPQRPNHVHVAHYKKGCALFASSFSEDRDVLWALSNDSFPFHSHILELHTTLNIDGRTWALAEVPLPQPSKPLCTLIINNNIIPSEPPLVVSQHVEVPRKFVLLSAQGSLMLTKPRPVDQLKQLFADNNGPECEAVKAFFMLHKETQACATCLILCCSSSPQDKQVTQWAINAFFLYGGEPHISYPTAVVPSGTLPMSTSIPSSPVQQVWTSTPLTGRHSPTTAVSPSNQLSTSPFSPLSTMMGSVPHPEMQQTSFLPHQSAAPSGIPLTQGPEVVYSGKLNGLYLYFSRILRPLWNMKVVSDVTCHNPQGKTEFLASSVSSEELSLYLEQLSSLTKFIQSSFPLAATSGAGSYNLTQNLPQRVLNFLRPESFTAGEISQIHQQLQKKSQAGAEMQERAALLNLYHLLNHTYEVLGLWKVLCDHQFHVMASMLSKDLQNQLKLMTCRDLIISGKEFAGSLVSALINRYLDDSASTDAISSRLREVCPSIYRNEDALFSKAHEMLLNAKNIQNKQEKEKVLKDALQLCKEVSPHLNLHFMCSLFQAVHFYHGIVDLCLSAAQHRDPQGLALHYYKNGEPREDQQGLQAYLRRMDCYKAVMEMLAHLMSLSTSHPQSPSVPKVPGPPPPRDPNLLSPEEVKAHYEEVFQITLKSDDELLHVALYDWLVERHQTDTLLEIKSPYLENYLKQYSCQQPDNVNTMDLMWKYYEKNNNFSAAARILAKLADKHCTNISLPQRLEYLSRAIMCVKSSEVRISSQGEGEFLHELEEKMEVARIQLQIVEMLQQKGQHINIQDVISRLNSDLLDITQLYEEFAEPYDLYECKLAVLHCAGHYDPTLVESLWQNIIDKDLSSTDGCSPQSRMVALSHKVRSLGKVYIMSQKYFPICFLVKYLECKTCILNFDPKWVFTTLTVVGVPLPALLEVYHKLYKSKDPCWHTVKKPFHLLQVICLLVTTFVETPNMILQTERRAFTNHCLDLVSGYLIDVSSMSIAEPAVQSLSKEFKAVQHRLERIL